MYHYLYNTKKKKKTLELHVKQPKILYIQTHAI